MSQSLNRYVEAGGHQSGPVQEQEREYTEAKTFEELYFTLRGQDEDIKKELIANLDIKTDGGADADDTKTIEDLIVVIEGVRAGKLPIEGITSKHDLRRLVEDLLIRDSLPTIHQEVEKSAEVNIHSFKDLYTTLEKQPVKIIEDLVSNIDGDENSADGKIAVSSLNKLIEEVRTGRSPIEAITNKHDLRDIVEELMIKEAAQFNFTHVSSFEELYKIIRLQNILLINELLEKAEVEGGKAKDAEYLIDLIDGVRDGSYPIEAITGKHNLWSVVSDLVRMENTQKKLKAHSTVIPRPLSKQPPFKTKPAPTLPPAASVEDIEPKEVHKKGGFWARMINYFR